MCHSREQMKLSLFPLAVGWHKNYSLGLLVKCLKLGSAPVWSQAVNSLCISWQLWDKDSFISPRIKKLEVLEKKAL